MREGILRSSGEALKKKTIGSFEGLGAGGLTHTHAVACVSSNTLLAPAFSVLTHPFLREASE